MFAVKENHLNETTKLMCPVCGIKFYSIANKDRHLRTVHTDYDPKLKFRRQILSAMDYDVSERDIDLNNFDFDRVTQQLQPIQASKTTVDDLSEKPKSEKNIEKAPRKGTTKSMKKILEKTKDDMSSKQKEETNNDNENKVKADAENGDETNENPSFVESEETNHHQQFQNENKMPARTINRSKIELSGIMNIEKGRDFKKYRELILSQFLSIDTSRIKLGKSFAADCFLWKSACIQLLCNPSRSFDILWYTFFNTEIPFFWQSILCRQEHELITEDFQPILETTPVNIWSFNLLDVQKFARKNNPDFSDNAIKRYAFDVICQDMHGFLMKGLCQVIQLMIKLVKNKHTQFRGRPIAEFLDVFRREKYERFTHFAEIQ